MRVPNAGEAGESSPMPGHQHCSSLVLLPQVSAWDAQAPLGTAGSSPHTAYSGPTPSLSGLSLRLFQNLSLKCNLVD